ncbi:MAG TPA: nitric oxide synthase oxygenase, partial [Isosphaeraceae bacterium]|nr:nitric oxide synthase oxygenase [Isosphaeraceae bacterium]
DGVKSRLLNAGVPDESIMIEFFTPAGLPADAPAPAAGANGCPVVAGTCPVSPVDLGPAPGFGMVDDADKLPPQEEARRFLWWFYREKGVPEAFESRWQEVETQFAATGTYTQTFDELSYGCKVSWRNSTRCIGRLFWQGLNVRDLRHLTTEEEVFGAIVEHVKLATNGGNLRATISVFDPGLPGAPAFRIWNPLVLRYAGYRQPDGSIKGDPANVELTEQCFKYGWRGGPGTMFDVLPLLIQRPGHPPKLFELPPEIILEVPIEHPRLRWFGELGLKWFALPMVSNMLLDIGGVRYSCVPFNGFYMGTEIGSRNFGDENRYNLLPMIAAKMGLDTRNDRTLWKDRVLIELNDAVLHSYEKLGVKMTDHHRASQDFMRFVEVEKAAGRKTNADWAWIIPPLSPSSVPVFHVEWENRQFKPNLFYQDKPWLAE